MKSICFFSCYYTSDSLPVYVKYYLEELRRHFAEVILISNEKPLSEDDGTFLQKNNLKILQVQNEGYDFGMWYKAMQQYDISQYDRVGLVNDSCILFGKLDNYFQWLEKSKHDFAGFTNSYLHGYHVQSYFLTINKNAIPLVADYFKKAGLVKEISKVIQTYELGLSKYLMDNGMLIGAMYNVPNRGEYNYALLHAKNLIKQGFPLVKKRIITRNYSSIRWWSMVVIGFDPYPSHYVRLIKRRDKVPENLFKELFSNTSPWYIIKFSFISFFAIICRVIRITRKQKVGNS